MGRPRTSPLAPILRSDAQGRVLAAVLLASEPLHVRAIADNSGLAYSVAQREVSRLEDYRLVRSTRFGTARVVTPNERHPLFPELRALMVKAYGPREVIGPLLGKEPGVEAAYIYGSWADRYSGNWGSPPGDVDVLLVGSPSVARVEELEVELEDAIGQPVQIVAVPRAQWARGAEPFLRTVKERPLVAIPLRGEA